MSIIEQLSYDSTNDQTIGVEDHDEKGRSNKLATYALVYMICGLLKKWKQPIAFYFPIKKEMSAEMLIEHLQTVIHACSGVGLCVLAASCDMDSTFVQAVKALGSTVSSPKCTFKGEIITLFDPLHQIYLKYAKKT